MWRTRANRQARRSDAPKFRKDIESKNLGVTLPGMSVTASALYAMDDMGGFDEDIFCLADCDATRVD